MYESSVRLAILSQNWQQLGACLPHLLFVIYPKLASVSAQSTSSTSLDQSLHSLSLAPPTFIQLPDQAYYQSLYLLYTVCYLMDLTSFHSTLSTFALDSELSLAQEVYSATLSSNFVKLYRLLHLDSTLKPPSPVSAILSPFPPALPPLTSAAKRSLQLAIIRTGIPRWRETAWNSIARSYKDFSDLGWLGRALLFAPDDRIGVENFVRLKRGLS